MFNLVCTKKENFFLNFPTATKEKSRPVMLGRDTEALNTFDHVINMRASCTEIIFKEKMMMHNNQVVSFSYNS